MHQEADHDSPAAAPRRSLMRTVLPYLNLLIAASLTLGLAGVTKRIVVSEKENGALIGELGRTRNLVRTIEEDHERKLAALRDLELDESEARRAEIESYARLIGGMEERLHSMESRSRDENDRTVAAFKGELAELRRQLEEKMRPKPSIDQVFRDFEREHRGAVVLVYTEFDYTKKRDSGEEARKTVTGWGSGFVITEDGYIVTNKHVVQPWKFDPDLAAMEALGEIEIDRDSLRVACWPTGCEAFDDLREPRTDRGFNSWVLNNLEVAIQAPDSMMKRDMEFGSFGPSISLHELNDNDIVLLKAKGAAFKPLPLHRDGDVELNKLDRVMALGFPRGQNGLEAGRVESSPSIGTVRKVENTIHVTASIIPGNSGGPLIGPDGEVVGIVTRVYSETLGICLKLEHALNLLEKVRTTEKAATALAAEKLAAH